MLVTSIIVFFIGPNCEFILVERWRKIAYLMLCKLFVTAVLFQCILKILLFIIWGKIISIAWHFLDSQKTAWLSLVKMQFIMRFWVIFLVLGTMSNTTLACYDLFNGPVLMTQFLRESNRGYLLWLQDVTFCELLLNQVSLAPGDFVAKCPRKSAL